jgi:hypothetical protein
MVQVTARKKDDGNELKASRDELKWGSTDDSKCYVTGKMSY